MDFNYKCDMWNLIAYGRRKVVLSSTQGMPMGQNREFIPTTVADAGFQKPLDRFNLKLFSSTPCSVTKKRILSNVYSLNNSPSNKHADSNICTEFPKVFNVYRLWIRTIGIIRKLLN